MRVQVVEGNLLDQDVDVIVNAWNRNVFPWWLLLPQGVSGEIRRRGGTAPFRELRSAGVLALGEAFLTGPGTLPFRAIIHVAGIGFLWSASRPSIRLSVRNAIALAKRERFRSVGLPLIGAGTGGFPPEQAEKIMLETLTRLEFDGDVRVVRYVPGMPLTRARHRRPADPRA
jgi:O-acetyl-ADP-ribose deacetylase (regulator of RNase III)